jgi:hypothetical protein
VTSHSFLEFASPSNATELAEWSEEVDLEQIDCPVDPSHRRGGRRLEDLSVVLSRRPARSVSWTWHSECLIQDEVVDLFREQRFTGWQIRPVRGRYMDSDEPAPRLWELVITGWGGVAPPASGVRFVSSCAWCGYLRYSCFTDPEQLIDLSQWDGSDFFMVWPLPRHIFVTTQVADALRAIELPGVRWVPLADLRCLFEGFSPGRLSYWMPRERAAQLGTAIGIA